MVDSINNNSHNIHELQTGQLQQNQQIERVNQEAAKAQQASVSYLSDRADVSEEAKARLNAEREALKFGRLAQQQPAPYDGDKVAYFKDLLDSGRINEYLRGVGNDSLADALLNSPVAAALK